MPRATTRSIGLPPGRSKRRAHDSARGFRSTAPEVRREPRRPIVLAAALLAACALCMPAVAPSSEFHVRARGACAMDLATGAWLFTQAADDTLSIASLTKVAAALTVVDLVPDLDATVTILDEDWRHAGRTRLHVGDRVAVRTLLRLALVSSDNCAARALAHALALDRETFALRMTLLARRLDCRVTQFVEPTGLDAGNISTAREVALLFRAALADPLLREMLGTTEFVLETRRGPRVMVHSARSVRFHDEVAAAKTGYTDAARYCLAQQVRDPGGDLLTVVLGADSKSRRYTESAALAEHARAMRRKGP